MDAFLEWFAGNVFKNVLATITLSITIIGIVSFYYRKYVTKDNMKSIATAFQGTIAGLSSDKNEVKMSSAILLRRFLDKDSEYGVGGTPYAASTVTAIAAILKSAQTSEFQKVLADTLRYAPSKFLMKGDFQRANLSKAYLGNDKEGINMEEADFFQANLSGALLKNCVLNKAVFYEASLNQTVLKRAQLREANFTSAVLQNVVFKGADLTNACFDNARLIGVDFTDAILEGAHGRNVEGCDNTGLTEGHFDIQPMPYSQRSSKTIFLSRLGALDARQMLFVNSIRDIVKKLNLSVCELNVTGRMKFPRVWADQNPPPVVDNG